MQSNLIIENTVKQKPLFLYLQLIIMYKPIKCLHQNIRPNMGLMSSEEG